MKAYPLVLAGVAVVSAAVGYFLHLLAPLESGPTAAPAGATATALPDWTSVAPNPKPDLSVLQAQNDLRDLIEEKQAALESLEAGASPGDDLPEGAVPVAGPEVFKYSAAPFYDELSPHGEWLEAGEYGEVWRPRLAENPDWQPYEDGGWISTDAGWAWDSYEPGGEITCHYGRWTQLVECGWCWVPGHDWAPAWVSWRCNDDVIGWAPLPPCVRWHAAVGLGPWVDALGDLGPDRYCFIRARHFTEEHCRPHLRPRGERAADYCATTNRTQVVSRRRPDGEREIVVRGPDPEMIRRVAAKDLRERRLVVVKGGVGGPSPELRPDEMRRRDLSLHPEVEPTKRPEIKRHFERVTAVPATAPEVAAKVRSLAFAEAEKSFRNVPRFVRAHPAPSPVRNQPRSAAIKDSAAGTSRSRPERVTPSASPALQPAIAARSENGRRAPSLQPADPRRPAPLQGTRRDSAIPGRDEAATPPVIESQLPRPHAIPMGARQQRQPVAAAPPQQKEEQERRPQIAEAQRQQTDQYQRQLQAAEDRRQAKEDQQRQAEENQRRQLAEQHQRQQQIAEQQRQAEQYQRQLQAAEERRQAKEHQQRQAEENQRRQQAEQYRRQQQIAEQQRQAEEEQRRQQIADSQRQQAEQYQRQLQAAEERRQAKEHQQRQAEDNQRRQQAEQHQRQQQIAEQQRQAEEQRQRNRQAEESQQRQQRQAEEESRKRADSDRGRGKR